MSVEPAPLVTDVAVTAPPGAGGGPPVDATGPAAAIDAPELVVPVAPVGSTTAARGGRRQGVALVALSVAAVLAGSVLFLSGWTLGRQTAVTPGTPADETELFQPFWDSYRAVTERYAGGDVDHKDLVEGAIKGMIGALEDPYSMYMTSEEFKQSLEGISGEFEGIGATIGTVDASGASSSCTDLDGSTCRMVVVAPIKGSPAERAGLLPGDVITHIDGVPNAGLDVDDARARIRGPKGTIVVLTIERDGAPRDVEIVRAVVVTPEVEAEDLAGGSIGYLRLSGFSDHASKQFADAVAEDVAAGRRKLILDLRGNPGGFVTAARDIASQFIPDGTIFWQEDADGQLIETKAKAGGAAVDPEIRLVVLVDGGSASASEIVAGALHDRDRATLIGTTTFGKGTVQQWTQLEDDRGGFRLTIAKWLTPDRTWVHGEGIEPDIVVDQPPQQPGDDPVLERALRELGAGSASLTELRAAA